MHDISNKSDIILLVDKFYEKVNADELLAPVFKHVDWPAHLPVMYNFWSSMLLGDSTYKGNPFQKHMDLAIKAAHFDRWLKLFSETVEENFEGIKAEETKNRARDIAAVFQYKLGIMSKN